MLKFFSPDPVWIRIRSEFGSVENNPDFSTVMTANTNHFLSIYTGLFGHVKDGARLHGEQDPEGLHHGGGHLLLPGQPVQGEEGNY